MSWPYGEIDMLKAALAQAEAERDELAVALNTERLKDGSLYRAVIQRAESAERDLAVLRSAIQGERQRTDEAELRVAVLRDALRPSPPLLHRTDRNGDCEFGCESCIWERKRHAALVQTSAEVIVAYADAQSRQPIPNSAGATMSGPWTDPADEPKALRERAEAAEARVRVLEANRVLALGHLEDALSDISEIVAGLSKQGNEWCALSQGASIRVEQAMTCLSARPDAPADQGQA